MRKIDPIFIYVSVLSVIQPARVQDIESSASELLPADTYAQIKGRNILRDAHSKAKEMGLVIQVRRGVYAIAQKARHIVRNSGLEREIDNRRLFLMKAQRMRYK
jgi:hypothetical protein